MFPKDPNEPRFIGWMRNARVRRTLTLSVLWLFIAFVIFRFHFVLLPFALAILLAFVLEPAVEFLSTRTIRGRQIPRVVAVIGIYVVLLTSLSFFGSWAVAQIGRELAGVGTVTKAMIGKVTGGKAQPAPVRTSSVGEAQTNSTGSSTVAISASDVRALTSALIDRVDRFAEQNQIPIERQEIEDVFHKNLLSALDGLRRSSTRLLTFGRDLVGATFRSVFGVFLVLMLTAFLSIDRARIERFFFSLVPPEYQQAYTTIMDGMSIGLAGVVRGQVLICLTNGVFTFLGLVLLKVKLPLLLATLATVFSLIPIFGSILSSIPIVAMALTDSFAKGIFALLWIIGIHLVEANFLNPKIMGDAAKIHPVVVVFALLVGEQSAGLIGALFAVPIASVVLTVFKFLHFRALQTPEAEPPAEGPVEEVMPPTPAGPTRE